MLGKEAKGSHNCVRSTAKPWAELDEDCKKKVEKEYNTVVAKRDAFDAVSEGSDSTSQYKELLAATDTLSQAVADKCACEVVFAVSGPNPNNLSATRVAGDPSTGEGVYIKKHFGKKKVGMTNNFRTRYVLSNPEGSCNIWYELPRTKNNPPTGVGSSAYWTERRQRRFDEAYIFGTVPVSERFGNRPVLPKKWRDFRHIFGYEGILASYLD